MLTDWYACMPAIAQIISNPDNVQTSKAAFKAYVLSLRDSCLTMLGRARADMFEHAVSLGQVML